MNETITKPGDTFNCDGANWIAVEVIPDQNEGFTWLKVIAKWSGFGPRPLWANDARTFYMDRRHKSTGVFVS